MSPAEPSRPVAAPHQQPSAADPEPARSAQPPAAGEQVRRPGGYYLDDGPLPNPPPGLERVPDAQPRMEAIRVANTKPYAVMGQTYRPMTAPGPYREEGLASWYGKRYHGQATASGEIYDMYAMTAAHPILPIPSYARVTNQRNYRSVVVRINDRGPFRSGRLIDLSYTAALKLDMLSDGSAPVIVEALVPSARPPAIPASTVVDALESSEPLVTRAVASGTYVQLGAFGMRDNADSFLRRARADLSELSGMLGVFTQGSVHRVQAGPYASRYDAQQAVRLVEGRLGFRPMLINR